MKKEDIPQDLSALGKITREVVYATDNAGNYTTELSKGWDVKITALNTAWEDIEERIETAKQKVLNNEASPLLYFMEKALMDIKLVADYTGFWGWQVKKHMKPAAYKKLTEKQLQRYAEIFNVSVDELNKLETHEA